MIDIDWNYIQPFADDTSIYITVKNSYSSTVLLNSDLEKSNNRSKNGLFHLTLGLLNACPFPIKLVHPSHIFDDDHFTR